MSPWEDEIKKNTPKIAEMTTSAVRANRLVLYIILYTPCPFVQKLDALIEKNGLHAYEISFEFRTFVYGLIV